MEKMHLVSFYLHNAAWRALACVSQAVTRCGVHAPVRSLTVDIEEVTCQKCSDLSALDNVRALAEGQNTSALDELESLVTRIGF